MQIGDMVVCIKDGPWESLKESEGGPCKGQILTIRDIYDPDYDGPFLRFEEIINPMIWWGAHYGRCECCFLASHFRPIRKTDISALLEAVNRAPGKVSA